LQELSTDSSQHVRAALASVIMGMAPVLGKVLFLTFYMFSGSYLCHSEVYTAHAPDVLSNYSYLGFM
jgi:hypothetical protein